jgi:pimeloyl-ACP methyl ester carboxylesterase
MRSRPLLVGVVALSLLGAACGSDGGLSVTKSDRSAGSAESVPGNSGPPPTNSGSGSGSGTGSGTGTIDWQPFGDGLETGSVEVPIDYDDPAKGTFDLFVLRHPAADPSQRIGTLLVNPGGPGFGGSVLAQVAENVYSPDLLDHFDIVGWDPRGTGLTTPAIDCIDDYDPYFATEYDGLSDEEARQKSEDVAVDFEQQCEKSNGDILQYVGTNNSARDMDMIRQALGEDTITYFGFSYGSELGATWATLFPDTVRAAVLDGAADPNADELEGRLQQSRGFEAALNTFLAQCSDDPDCAFHNGGDAEGAYDALIESLSENPIPSDPGRPDVEVGVATFAVIQAMYSESLWPDLAKALAAAQDGDGSGLLALYDEYYQRQPDGTYDNSLEAFQVISCADTAERQTVEEADAEAHLYVEAAPRLNGHSEGGSYFCTFFPPSVDPRVTITGAGAGPILVVGTTGDPATPLESSRNMAEALEDGVLLTVEADQHTGYDVNECSKSTIDAYLIDLEVPAADARC